MSRPPKRRRTPSELKQLAIQLHLGWVPGDSIIGHLRKLTPTIQNMLWHDGIHVEDIAAALNLAGIKYRTGTEWTRTTLQNKLTHARNTLHQKSTQENKFSTRANTNKKLRSASTAANVKPLSPQPPAPDAPTQPKELRSTVSHPTDPRSPIAAAASSFVAPPNPSVPPAPALQPPPQPHDQITQTHVDPPLTSPSPWPANVPTDAPYVYNNYSPARRKRPLTPATLKEYRYPDETPSPTEDTKDE